MNIKINVTSYNRILV